MNLKTGRFTVPIPPGASKADAKAAMGTLPAAYPLVERTYAELRAKADSLSERLGAGGNVMVEIQERTNKVRVLYSTAMTTGARTNIKAQAEEPGVIVQAGKGFGAEPQACDFPYCHGEAVGGIRINGPLVEGRPTTSCSAAFMAENGWGEPLMLTAGHCTQYPPIKNLGPWLARNNQTCLYPPAGGCEPVPPTGSECELWPERARLDTGGDFATLRAEDCAWRPVIASWFSGQDQLIVKKIKPIFNCMTGAPCNVPSQEKAYPGLFECHYGQHADVEQPGQRFYSNCGVVAAVDTQVAIGYASPPGTTTVKHLDLLCSNAIAGDSGSGTVAPAGTHGIATGIAIAGYAAVSTECGDAGKTWIQEIGPALQGLGVHLP